MKRTLLATLAIALLPSADGAAARTYDVYSCWAGADTYRNPNASSAAWTRDQSGAGGHFATQNDCGVTRANGTMSVMSLGTSAFARNGEYARLSFTPPVATTVQHVELWRNAWSYGIGSGTDSQRNNVRVLADGAPVSGGTDADGTADVAYGTRGTASTSGHGLLPQNALSLGPMAANSVEYRVGCGWSAGCATTSALGPNNVASGFTVYGAEVTVEDSRSPSLDVADSGLFSDGTASGVGPVVIQDASDESGIKMLAVYADFHSTPIAIADYEQDVNRCDWSTPAPCQNISETQIPVDTRQLADGDHPLVVKAFDAAGNEKASTAHYVTVKNHAESTPTPTPTPPTDTTKPAPTDPGATNSTGLPNGISSGTVSTGTGTGGGPTLTVRFDHNGKGTLKARYGRMVTLRGHLRGGDGAVIANAQIDYSARVTRAGARAQDLGSVRTNGDGTFVLHIATKLGSRTLRFGYRPLLGGAVATSAHAQLNVMAPLSLSVGPKHVHNKHAVVFTGRLTAGPIPRKGKIVNLQVVVDGHWHTFATVRSLKSGRFKFRYRFMRTYGMVTYRFRALSRYEAAYPFVAGSSRTVRVHVNGCPCE
jgi:hypothetical protein